MVTSTKVSFILYDRTPSLVKLFRKSASEIQWSSKTNQFDVDVIDYKPHVALADVLKANKVDTIVSPANSYGFMYGGFDAVISNYYGSQIPGLTQKDVTVAIQKSLRAQCGGYNPPMSAQVIDMTKALDHASRMTPNAPDVPILVHLPTMSLPGTTIPKSPVVFYSMWNLMTAILAYNSRSDVSKKITRVLITGLGTGVGGVPEASCVRQMCDAIKLFNTNLNSTSEGMTSETSLEIESTIKNSYLV